jgi:hypothetical protein
VSIWAKHLKPSYFTSKNPTVVIERLGQAGEGHGRELRGWLRTYPTQVCQTVLKLRTKSAMRYSRYVHLNILIDMGKRSCE